MHRKAVPHRRVSRRKVAPSVKRFVKRAIKGSQEIMCKSNVLNVAPFSAINNTWSEVELTDIAEGDDSVHRKGRELTLSALHLRGVLVGAQSNTALDDQRNILRVVIAIWDGTRGATPLATNGATIDSFITPKFQAGVGLYRKLMDRLIVVSSAGRDSVGYMPAQKVVQIFKKLRLKVKYGSSASNTAERRLVMSIISDSAAPVNPGFVQGHYAIYWRDA